MSIYAYLLIERLIRYHPSAFDQCSTSLVVQVLAFILFTSLFWKRCVEKGLGFRLYGWLGPPVYMVPLTALATFLISYAIVFILQKIPVLKMIVP